ncbi:uncharacterized protein LOC143285427 [Babylonia areolata]|uniref:uncharacterized protein LOC143285427 n=1 Tax=Babylonia areolata TaxID=304850 RepID=UPI003FD41CAE
MDRSSPRLLSPSSCFYTTTTLLLLLGTLYSLYPSADARLRALPLPRQLKDCYLRAQNYSVQNYVGGLYCWYCETPVRAYVKGSPTPLKPPQYAYYRELYKKVEPYTKAGGFRGKRQAARCIRKEYRMLTDEERRRFHEAVNTLKRDTTVEPNKYDALALFHTGVATFVAHGGYGFPGWHSVYLMLFEAALQDVDPSVCLPYWDSSMDSALPNPSDSYVWSGDFFGSWDGEVVHGAFANWRTPEGMTLTRSVNRDGQPFTREGIEAIMSRNTYEEILSPSEDPQYSLEIQHGGAHVFVGGAMERLDTAAFDIIFFLHHAFVDYIWDMFRNKMRNNGLDPERYPTGGEISDYHLPNAPMGFGNLTQAEGYLDTLRESYEYQPSPECSRRNPDCGSKYLWCNVTVARCVPIDPRQPPVPVPVPGPNPPPPPPPQPCPSPKPQACQNSFCVDGVCDVNQWVWMPVKIVAQRPPEFHDYQSYPVSNGKISKGNDIYEPSGYSATNVYIKKQTTQPRAYEQCENKDGVGRIFVTSMGVNYDGSYKESAIIDQRLATSIGVTYVAVKDPGPKGVTEVILRAHDQCGRICHTACRIPGSNPARYEACSGVVEVTSQYPRQYGQTYARATLDVYDYASNSDCPSFTTEDFFLTFYCDYRDHLPWVERAANPITGPQAPRTSPVVHRPSNSNQCRLSSECVINQKCFTDPRSSSPRQCDTYMEAHACDGNCGRYAVCIYGFYWPRYCPSGMYFDEVKGICVRGPCPSSPHSSSRGGGGGGFGAGGFTRPRDPVAVDQTPTAVSFGSGGYYGRLLNRFKFGRGK